MKNFPTHFSDSWEKVNVSLPTLCATSVYRWICTSS